MLKQEILNANRTFCRHHRPSATTQLIKLLLFKRNVYFKFRTDSRDSCPGRHYCIKKKWNGKKITFPSMYYYCYAFGNYVSVQFRSINLSGRTHLSFTNKKISRDTWLFALLSLFRFVYLCWQHVLMLLSKNVRATLRKYTKNDHTTRGGKVLIFLRMKVAFLNPPPARRSVGSIYKTDSKKCSV